MVITKNELKEMYYSMTNKELCDKLGITNATLVSYLKKNGIKLKGKGNKASQPKIKIIA